MISTTLAQLDEGMSLQIDEKWQVDRFGSGRKFQVSGSNSAKGAKPAATGIIDLVLQSPLYWDFRRLSFISQALSDQLSTKRHTHSAPQSSYISSPL